MKPTRKAAKVKAVPLKARMSAAELDLLEQAQAIREARDVPPYFMGIVCLQLAAFYTSKWEMEQQSTPLAPRRASRGRR